jgi:hypothetical protein
LGGPVHYAFVVDALHPAIGRSREVNRDENIANHVVDKSVLNALRVPIGAHRDVPIVGHNWDRAPDCAGKSENRATIGETRASHTGEGDAIGVNNVRGYLSPVVNPNCKAVRVFSRTRIIDVGILAFFPDRQMRDTIRAPVCQSDLSLRVGIRPYRVGGFRHVDDFPSMLKENSGVAVAVNSDVRLAY